MNLSLAALAAWSGTAPNFIMLHEAKLPSYIALLRIVNAPISKYRKTIGRLLWTFFEQSLKYILSLMLIRESFY